MPHLAIFASIFEGIDKSVGVIASVAVAAPVFATAGAWVYAWMAKNSWRHQINQRLAGLDERLKDVQYEMKPNSGKSMRDELGRITTSLAENTWLTQQAISLTGSIAFRSDVAGQCVWVSEEWSKITGMSLEQARGNGWIQAIDERDRDTVYHDWIESCGHRRPFEHVYRYVNAMTGVSTTVRDRGAEVTVGEKVTGFFRHCRIPVDAGMVRT